jgi:hypothetical protein
MPTSEDSGSKSQASASDAWRAFEGLCDAAQRVFGLASELVFIAQQKSGGMEFTLLALVKPIWSLVTNRTLWLKRM